MSDMDNNNNIDCPLSGDTTKIRLGQYESGSGNICCIPLKASQYSINMSPFYTDTLSVVLIGDEEPDLATRAHLETGGQ